MNIFKDKTLLFVGGSESVGRDVIQHALNNGVKEIRVLNGNEELLVAMRDELLAQQHEAAAKVKYYCANMNDTESVDDSMSCVDLVLCIPSLKAVTDIESYPADACCDLLDSVDNVMQSAIEHSAEKVVVLTPDYKGPLYQTLDLLAALLEKVVIAQGRYQKKDAKTTICCARMEDDVLGVIDYAFAEAYNGGLVLKTSVGYSCRPCYNPDFERDDFSNL